MKDARGPFLPADYEAADVTAIQQLERGEATPDMQKRALAFIIATCGTYDASYWPESDRDTCFSEGKRYVGNTIVKMLKLNPSKVRRQK